MAPRPDWVDPELFPLESRYVELDGARVHYVDDGSGLTLLMLHGNPTWSFLYVDVIGALRDRFRCVALDYPGFGLSTARPGYEFTPAEHAEVVRRFVEELALEGINPVMQDWGGPIGLGAAARSPNRVRALAILNTFAWPMNGNRAAEGFSRFMGGPIGGFAIRRLNAFVNVIIPAASQRARPPRRVMEHYRRPFPSPASREPTHVFPREILAPRGFLAEVEQGLKQLRDRPALICFPDKDPAFGEAERERFELAFPNHQTTIVERAGHYVQEDAPEEVAAAIAAWHPDLRAAQAAARGSA